MLLGLGPFAKDVACGLDDTLALHNTGTRIRIATLDARQTYTDALQALGPTANSPLAFLGSGDSLVLQDRHYDSPIFGLTLGS